MTLIDIVVAAAPGAVTAAVAWGALRQQVRDTSDRLKAVEARVAELERERADNAARWAKLEQKLESLIEGMNSIRSYIQRRDDALT